MNIHSDMDSSLTRFEALMLCVERAGSISQLGRDLGIPQATMSRIVNSSKQLPAEQGQVLTAERLYGVVHDGEWFHVGTPEGLQEAKTYMHLPYAGTTHR